MWNIFNTETNKKRQNINLSITGKNGENIEDPSKLAHIFNDHFSLSGGMHRQDSSVTDWCNTSIFLGPINRTEVVNILQELPNKYSSGLDEIPIAILKAAVDYVSEPIADIINSSFTTGIFPTSLKVAKITPVHKGGGRSDLDNYRAVSLLPVVSKVFERSLYAR